MKRTDFMTRTSLALFWLSVALFLNSGCNHRPTSESPAAKRVSAEKNSFKEVAAYLDTGGHFYLYLSTEQWLKTLSQGIAEGQQFLLSLPMISEADKGNMNKVLNIATSLVKESGVEQVSGVGMSSIALQPGFYQSKAILHHYPGQGAGFLWSFFGKATHPLKTQDMLSANTAFALFQDVDLPMIWTVIQELVSRAGIPEAEAWLKQAPSLFANATGIPLDKLLNSLGGEVGLVITLDEGKKTSIPLPTGSVIEFPEPGLMLVLKVKDDTIFSRVDELLKDNPMVTRADKEGFKMRTVSLPIPLPIPLRPSLGRSGDYLFWATTDAMIEEAVAIQRGQKKGLKETEEFKQLTQGMPTQGNQYVYASARFGQNLMEVQKKAIEAQGKLPAGQTDAMQKMLNLQKPGFIYAVAGNTPEGWLLTGNGNQTTGPVVVGAAVAAPLGLMAAIAIPNFIKARQTAQKNAIISNLRMLDGAKEQWALENKKTPGTKVTEVDISPYLKSGKVKAVVGETYELNAIGSAPHAIVPVAVGGQPAGSKITLP